jgi:hypothetical protein
LSPAEDLPCSPDAELPPGASAGQDSVQIDDLHLTSTTPFPRVAVQQLADRLKSRSRERMTADPDRDLQAGELQVVTRPE